MRACPPAAVPPTAAAVSLTPLPPSAPDASPQAVAPGRPVVLVGASLGGAVALDFALSYSERVSRLVLVDSQVKGAAPC
jgi:pimeloyl-ACP methyl ester carboxylesterase